MVGPPEDLQWLRLLCKAVIAAGELGKSERLAKAGAHMLLAHDLAAESGSLVRHSVRPAEAFAVARGFARHFPEYEAPALAAAAAATFVPVPRTTDEASDLILGVVAGIASELAVTLADEPARELAAAPRLAAPSKPRL